MSVGVLVILHRPANLLKAARDQMQGVWVNIQFVALRNFENAQHFDWGFLEMLLPIYV